MCMRTCSIFASKRGALNKSETYRRLEETVTCCTETEPKSDGAVLPVDYALG